MKLQWESYNMAWGFYFNLSFESLYIAITLAGIDVEFHIHNLRSICYGDDDDE